MKVLIIAAGEGTRLRPLTYTRPKPMIPILGKPMLEHIIQQLRDLGHTEIVLIVGYQREKIENYFGSGKQYGVSLKYAVQEEMKGEANAILCAESYLKNESMFLMLDGDFFADQGMIKTTVDLAQKGNADITMALTRVSNPSQFGIVDLDAKNNVRRIIEKPSPGTEPSNLGVSSIYIFKGEFFNSLHKTNDLEKSIQNYITDRKKVIGNIWEGEWIDVGRPWDVLRANRFLLDRLLSKGKQVIHETARIHPNANLEGPIWIGKDVQIGCGSSIKGPVWIGDNSFIGDNNLIRAYTSLGTRSEIGFSNELRNVVTFDQAVVSHLCYVGDSVLGSRVHLGAGSITANFRFNRGTIHVNVKGKSLDSGLTKFGTVIGDSTDTGVNTSIYPGRLIGNNCQIGPGVVVTQNVDPYTQLLIDPDYQIKKLTEE